MEWQEWRLWSRDIVKLGGACVWKSGVDWGACACVWACGVRVHGSAHLERELGMCSRCKPARDTEHRDTNMCQDGDGRREEIWTRTRVHRACGQAGADTRRGEAMEAAARAAE